MNTPTVLTIENAHLVATIINIKNPEWGSKRFNYNDQQLTEGRVCSSFGVGCNSAILSDNEFKFWHVATWK